MDDSLQSNINFTYISVVLSQIRLDWIELELTTPVQIKSFVYDLTGVNKTMTTIYDNIQTALVMLLDKAAFVFSAHTTQR